MKNSIVPKIVILILIAASVVIILNRKSTKEEKPLVDKTQIENDIKASNSLLKQRLGESERQRLLLARRADSIDLRNRALVRADSKVDSLLKIVKGKYKDRTVSELETEMIKRYNASR